jgi:23S rRNA pseudouridine1911/1915/1917 synthase
MQRYVDKQVVPGDAVGERFDRVAAKLFPGFSRSRIQEWIRRGQLTADGETRRPSARLAGTELLELNAEMVQETGVAAEDIPLAVLHADDDLLVINKPAGLVVHPAAGNPDGTLQNALLYYDSDLAALPRSGIVHRLDKDTSGVMVVARNLQAHKVLVEHIHARAMSREYRAVVIGEVAVGGTINKPIGRHPRDRIRMAVIDGGKPSVTHYRVLERYNGFSLLQVKLETGRTHQIRVHMAHSGYPLVGDRLYGGRRRIPAGLSEDMITTIRAFPRQALHAYKLRFPHPGDGQPCEFQAPLPADFEQLLTDLEAAR